MTQDTKLIDRVLGGDLHAFAALVKRYQASVYALALRHYGRLHDAEEIAQDVFLSAYRNMGALRDKERFGAWLRSITLNQCRMRRRSEARKPATLGLVVEPGSLTDATEIARGDEDGQPVFGVDGMIAALPAAMREAAVLCFGEGIAPAAAAQVLRIKPGTLRKRLHDARVRLQRRIVLKAEKEFRMYLLPKDFARKCVCRCGRPRGTDKGQAGKEVIQMARKRSCGCGCVGKAQNRPKPKTKGKKKPG